MIRVYWDARKNNVTLRRRVILEMDDAATMPMIFLTGGADMKTFTAVVEKCSDTGLYVGYVPGFPGAHTQAGTLDELNDNLREVVEMLLEDGEPKVESQFIGIQMVKVA